MKEWLKHIGVPELWHGAEHHLPVSAFEVQAALALAEYREVHHRKGINTAHWQENDPELQSAAMVEWTGEADDPKSFAAAYRRYVETHPHKRVDIKDGDVLKEILTALSKNGDEKAI